MNEETLFHQALEQQAAACRAFLDKMCGDDHALRQRAEARLQAHNNPGKRSVLAFLLATAVLLVMLLAGSGIVWVEELARREAETEKAVTAALAKAEQAEERAKRLPCSTSVEATAMLAEWRDAAAALAEAEAALTTGAATDDLRERVAKVRHRIEAGRTRAQRTEKLFRDLEDARMGLGVWVDNRLDFAGAAARYAAAFAAFGLEVQPGQTEKVAQRIRDEEPAVRDALIVALDVWAYCAENPAKKDLLAIAGAADNDAWRRDNRKAVVDRDRAALARMSKEARRLSLPPSSLHLLALSLVNAGERDEAQALLRWSLGRYPSDFWLHFALGNQLLAAKAGTPLQVEEAIGCFRAASALRPDASMVHNNLGNALMAENQWDDAIGEFKKAVELDPKVALAHFNLGNALQSNNQLDDAIAEFKKALALDPKFAQAHDALGMALQAKNQLDDAIAEFKKAIELDPKDARAHYHLGGALMAKKQLDEAIAEFRKAIELDPKFAEAHNGLGMALLAKNQLDEAIAAFRKALELDPNLASARKNLENALKAKK